MGSLNDLYAERDRLNQQITAAETQRETARREAEDALYDLLNTTPEFTKTERKGSAIFETKDGRLTVVLRRGADDNALLGVYATLKDNGLVMNIDSNDYPPALWFFHLVQALSRPFKQEGQDGNQVI